MLTVYSLVGYRFEEYTGACLFNCKQNFSMNTSRRLILFNGISLAIPVFFVFAVLVSAAEKVGTFSVGKSADGKESAPVDQTKKEPSEDSSDTRNVSAPVDMSDSVSASLPASGGVEAEIAPKEPTNMVSDSTSSNAHLLHRGVTATLFWVGESASDDNKQISNVPSAWDETWDKSYGGVDDPKKRKDFFPSKFTPKENPFYFALPYNDFDKKGKRRSDALSIIPWAKDRQWRSDESICKNQWAKIMKDGKAVYAQWEDVGPFGENDTAYVFGTAEPKSKTNKHAGIDLSPAVNDYLGLSDQEKVDWQFVSADQVPEGPWKQVVTTSQVNWK